MGNTSSDREVSPGLGPGRHGAAEEAAGYLPQGGEQLYYVRHASRAPRRGQVLLAGPMGCERGHTYTAWVRWARYLAGQGFDVLRFDYRGMGESTGRLEALGFADWYADLEAAAAWLRAADDGAPLVLHGLGLGTLLAARAFETGLGAGLLLWGAPPSAREMLQGFLRYRLAEDFVLAPAGGRQGMEAYVANLEAGRGLVVEGYPWPPTLWAEAADWPLRTPAAGAQGRPWKMMPLPEVPAYLLTGMGRSLPPASCRGQRPLNPGILTEFFAQHREWLDTVCPPVTGA